MILGVLTNEIKQLSIRKEVFSVDYTNKLI
jgi:hypothetical protein